MRCLLLIGMTCLLTSGCTLCKADPSGTHHHVVLGFGVISLPSDADAPAHVSRLKAMGLVVSDAPGPRLAIGYTSALQTQIKADAKSLYVEISDSPFGPLTVSASGNTASAGAALDE